MQDRTGNSRDIIRVLLVDDEESQRELTKLNLASADPSFEIKATLTPSEALRLLSGQPFDCIVSDYQMPEMNGIQFCVEIRKTRSIPFIIYTGRGSEEVASAAFLAGVDDYVRKEETLAHYHILARSIRHAVEKKRAEEALREAQKTFSELVDYAPFGIYIVDSQFRIAQMNIGSREGAFRNVRPVIGRDFTEAMHILWPEPVAEEIIANFRHTLDTGEPYHSQRFANPRHDIGTVESYEWELYRMMLTDGQFGVVCYYFDSTKLREAEEKLRVSEERFRSIFENSPNVIYRFNLQTGQYEYMSPAIRSLSYEPEELTAMSYEEVLSRVHPDDLPNLRKSLASLNETGKALAEYRFRGSDEAYTWWSNQMILIRDAEGKPIYRDGFVRDVTQQKDAETALRESEERFRVTFEQAAVGIEILDFSGRFLSSNNTLGSLLGYTREELLALRFSDITVDEDLEREQPLLTDLLNDIIHSYTIEKRYIRKTGEPVWVRVTSSIAKTSNPYRFSIIEDITEQKRLEEQLLSSNEELHATNEKLFSSYKEFAAAEEELRASNEKVQEYVNRLEDMVGDRTKQLHESASYARSLIEASLDPLVTISKDGRITDVNEATVKITGVPRGELIGSDFSDYFTDPENARVGFRKVFEEGQVRDYPLTIRHRSGGLTDVLYNVSVYRDPSGEVAGIFAAARDISQLRSLEEKLHRTEVIAAVEQIGATVAHDLRGPMGQVVQAVNMIKRDPSLTPRMLQIVEENAVRSLKMIADWRSSTRQIMPQPVKTDVGALVKSVLEGSTLPPNVQVVTSFGDGLDSVNLDPDIMHRVIDNLVKNAVEAMPSGGQLTIGVNRVADKLVLSVGDTGVGIPGEARERIWSPLYTTKPGGMGLGLTYSRRAVETMGGLIDFESEVGKGTMFTIKMVIQ